MKTISWNVNGLRAVYKKGFLSWFEKENPAILCLQEIKVQTEDLPKELKNPKDYFVFFDVAAKKGYSGVAVYSKTKPQKIALNIGLKRFDDEGRFLQLDFSDFILINIYLPYGGRGKENLEYKLKCYEALFKHLKQLKNKKIILVGDFNIAHTELDLAQPKQNKNNIMFTKEEREKIDELLKIGFVDSFRQFHKEGGHYSWWLNYYNARERNLGWRIDYCFVSKSLVPKLKSTFILKDVMGSDHAPVGIEIT